MNRIPLSHKGNRPGTNGPLPIQTSFAGADKNTRIQIIDEADEARKYRKDTATAMAKMAMLGVKCYELPNGAFKLVCGRHTQHCMDLGVVQGLLLTAGGRP